MTQKWLGLIIPCKNEELNIGNLLNRISEIGINNSILIYPIVIDDGSKDKTYKIAQKMLEKLFFNKFSLISFTRNFGKEASIFAGLKESKSLDCCIVIDADFQDSPELIVQMYKRWLEGAQIVSCIRTGRIQSDGIIMASLTSIFYFIFKASSKMNYRRNVGDFRLIDQKVINYLLSFSEINTFYKGMTTWIGAKEVFIECQRPKRKKGSSGWDIWTKFNYAIDGIFSFSTVPIRIWSYIGFLLITIGLVYLFTLVLINIFGFVAWEPGFLTTVSIIFIIGGFNLIGIGLLGEYVGRIFQEVKNRPKYFVRQSTSNLKNINSEIK